jgi:hypothetical protein
VSNLRETVPDGYRTQSEDTSISAELFLLDAWRKWTPQERLQRAWDASAFARGVAEGAIRQLHPEASEREILLRVASRRIDRDLMVRAFGWDPEVHGY